MKIEMTDLKPHVTTLPSGKGAVLRFPVRIDGQYVALEYTLSAITLSTLLYQISRAVTSVINYGSRMVANQEIVVEDIEEGIKAA